MKILGIDTSNYMTSVAVVDDQGVVHSDLRVPIPVPQGERGLRQSEAFFNHIKNLPELIEQVMSGAGADQFGAVVASVSPRQQPGSYMPVFLSGTAVARVVAATLRIPFIERSHQEGHLCAALASSGFNPQSERFLAVHLSGGTTELLEVDWGLAADNRPRIKLLGGTSDLNAGQFVDRIGVMLGLPFPAGTHLERLAAKAGGTIRLTTAIQDLNPSFSGPAAQAERLLAAGAEPAEIALAVQNAIVKVLEKWLLKAVALTGLRQVLISGGVAANRYIRERLSHRLAKRDKGITVYFGEPKLSGDNAVGLALSYWYPVLPPVAYSGEVNR